MPPDRSRRLGSEKYVISTPIETGRRSSPRPTMKNKLARVAGHLVRMRLLARRAGNRGSRSGGRHRLCRSVGESLPNLHRRRCSSALSVSWAATVEARSQRTQGPGTHRDRRSGRTVDHAGGRTAFNWKSCLIGFLLFRLFDIWKPAPVRQLERCPRNRHHGR